MIITRKNIKNVLWTSSDRAEVLVDKVIGAITQIKNDAKKKKNTNGNH